MNIALILAGGRGTRFGGDHPKQFVEIEKKPLIVHTLEKFSNCKFIDKIFVVCLKNYVDEMKEIIKRYSINKIEDIIIGGNTRHESIRNGINYLLNNKYDKLSKIVIHNANMPLVTISNIEECILKCDKNTIVTTVAKCNGFFYQISEDDNSLAIGPDRNNLLHAKVPEGMYLEIANEIYNDKRFDEKKYESYTAGMLGILMKKSVVIAICASTNMKITTKEDYKLVETYFKNETSGDNKCIK